MTTNNVRVMASFDACVMCEMPLELATRCFSDLYRGFKLRSWVQVNNEQVCRDKYISVLTHLRDTRASLSSSPGAFHDVVDFLSILHALKERGTSIVCFGSAACVLLTNRLPCRQ